MTILKSGEEVDAKCHSVWEGGGERREEKKPVKPPRVRQHSVSAQHQLLSVQANC